MILICLLNTCGVWIESVDPVADLCRLNQVFNARYIHLIRIQVKTRVLNMFT